MDVTIRRHDEAARYELFLDGRLASFADYHDDGRNIVLPHTVTLPEFRGQGLAGRLVQAALDDIRVAGRQVVPSCWFVADFIDDHPAYQDMVA